MTFKLFVVVVSFRWLEIAIRKTSVNNIKMDFETRNENITPDARVNERE